MPVEPFDLSFRPVSYELAHREIDFPILAEAPLFGGGSYLPGLAHGDIEIAGVALASTLGDVISIRAHRTRSGRTSYRVVDEYGTTFRVPRHVRPGPLSMDELIELIDMTEFGLGDGLVNSYLEYNWMDGEGHQSPDELRNFVVVLSEFYPQLGAYYDQRVADWVEVRRHPSDTAPDGSDGLEA